MAKLDNQTKLMLIGYAGIALAYTILFIVKYKSVTKS